MDKEIKFGIEIEFAKTSINLIDDFLLQQNIKNFIVAEESLVSEWEYNDKSGGEIISGVLTGTDDEWDTLEKIISFLEKNDAFIDENCGLHFHINFLDYNIDINDLKSLIALWYNYEEIIYKYTSGDFGKIRNCAIAYADSVRSKINYMIQEENDTNLNNLSNLQNNFDSIGKSYGINILYLQQYLSGEQYKLPTIEFRCANSTLNINLIKLYLEFFNRLIMCAKKNKITIEEIKEDCDFSVLNYEEEELINFINLIFLHNEYNKKNDFYNLINLLEINNNILKK